MADHINRMVNFGLGKINVLENVVAPYEKMSNPYYKTIRHPSQEFMIKIKHFDSKIIFNEAEKKALKQFKNTIEAITLKSKTIYKKKVFIVVPPTKPEKANQVLSLMRYLNIKNIEGIIGFKSESYSLKKKNKHERAEYLTNSYKKWELWNGPSTLRSKDNYYFIFVDDILTTGATSFFTMKAIQNWYHFDQMPFYRSVYIMATNPTEEYMESRKFDDPSIWDGII